MPKANFNFEERQAEQTDNQNRPNRGFDTNDVTNKAAMPTNENPDQPENVSLRQQVEARQPQDKTPEGFRVQLHLKNTGLMELRHQKQVYFDAGFVMVEQMNGLKTAYPASEVHAVIFGPDNLVWD